MATNTPLALSLTRCHKKIRSVDGFFWNVFFHPCIQVVSVSVAWFRGFRNAISCLRCVTHSFPPVNFLIFFICPLLPVPVAAMQRSPRSPYLISSQCPGADGGAHRTPAEGSELIDGRRVDAAGVPLTPRALERRRQEEERRRDRLLSRTHAVLCPSATRRWGPWREPYSGTIMRGWGFLPSKKDPRCSSLSSPKLCRLLSVRRKPASQALESGCQVKPGIQSRQGVLR